MMDEALRASRIRRLAHALKYWVRERQSTTGMVVTADALIARAKRREPSLTDAELEVIYQVAG